jgi:hypothetical protein
MRWKIIIFNGPPGSGKDTLADILEKKYHCAHIRFKDGLVPLVLAAYHVDQEWFSAHYTRELKDRPCTELAGMSPRQALINMSENVIKPAFGEAAFGLIAVKRINPEQMTVFSDGGFVSELRPIIDAIGAKHTLIIQLSRPGCTFENDSRSYYPENVLGCTTVWLDNTGTIDELYERVDMIVQTTECI